MRAKEFWGLIATSLAVVALVGCSAGSQQSTVADSTTSSSISISTSGAPDDSSGARIGGFASGEYGFKGGDNSSIDKMTISYAYTATGDSLEAAWDAPGLDTDGVAYTDANCSVHYGTLYDTPAFEGVTATPTADLAFSEYIDYVSDMTSLDRLGVVTDRITISSIESVTVGGRQMSRTDGELAWVDKSTGASGSSDIVGYATVVPGTLLSDDEDTIAWFVVVGDPENPPDASVLSDVAQKTAESFRIE